MEHSSDLSFNQGRDADVVPAPVHKKTDIFNRLKLVPPVIAALSVLGIPLLPSGKPSNAKQNLKTHLTELATFENKPNHTVYRDLLNRRGVGMAASQVDGQTKEEALAIANGDFGKLRAETITLLQQMIADLTEKKHQPFPGDISDTQVQLIKDYRERPVEALRMARDLARLYAIDLEKHVGLTDEHEMQMYQNALRECIAAWQEEQPDLPFSQTDFFDDFCSNMVRLTPNGTPSIDDVLAMTGIPMDADALRLLNGEVQKGREELAGIDESSPPSHQVSMK